MIEDPTPEEIAATVESIRSKLSHYESTAKASDEGSAQKAQATANVDMLRGLLAGMNKNGSS